MMHAYWLKQQSMRIWRHFTPILLLLLTACSGTLQYKHVLNSGILIPKQYEINKTPFFPQDTYQCGPAALATVLNYHGTRIKPEQLSPLMYLPERKGSLAIELTTAARRMGYLAYPGKLKFRTLLAELINDHPVLILQNLGLSWYPRWHYAVVIGYDLTRQHIVLRSGIHERVLMDLATFERTWKRGDYWSLLILQPGMLPIEVEPLKYLQAIVGLERAKHWQAAHISYNRAVQQWPTNITAWMGLGNSAYALHKLIDAEQAYRQALLINQQYAPAYNNLAQVLAEQQRWNEAERMARHAVNLGGPYRREYQKTLRSIQSKQL